MEENIKKLIDEKNINELKNVINKMNVSKAIEKIAEQEDKDVSTIWKNYYPKVKDKIDEMLDSK